LGISGASIATHDFIGSPLLYTGPGFGIIATYYYMDSTTLQRAALGVSVSPLTARVRIRQYEDTHGATGVLAESRYDYERNVRSLSTRAVQTYVGAGLSSSLFLRRYNYRENFQSSVGSASGDGLISLDGVASALHEFGVTTRTSVSLSLPLVGFVARPDWGITPKYDDSYLSWFFRTGSVRVIGQYAAWRVVIEGEQDLGSCFRARLSLQNDYFDYKRDEWRSSSLRTTGVLGLEWRFGS
jgi:hypothetical protein